MIFVEVAKSVKRWPMLCDFRISGQAYKVAFVLLFSQKVAKPEKVAFVLIFSKKVAKSVERWPMSYDFCERWPSQ